MNFTIYKPGGHRDHVTKTGGIEFHFPTLRSLYLKLEFNWPYGF